MSPKRKRCAWMDQSCLIWKVLANGCSSKRAALFCFVFALALLACTPNTPCLPASPCRQRLNKNIMLQSFTNPDRVEGTRSTAAGKRPKLSLASLIGQAILSSPGQKARLGTIYEWISTRYPDYYKMNCGGWQVRLISFLLIVSTPFLPLFCRF